jgi:hypothetical protein
MQVNVYLPVLHVRSRLNLLQTRERIFTNRYVQIFQERSDDEHVNHELTELLVKAAKFEAIKQIVDAAVDTSSGDVQLSKRIFCNHNGCGELGDYWSHTWRKRVLRLPATCWYSPASAFIVMFHSIAIYRINLCVIMHIHTYIRIHMYVYVCMYVCIYTRQISNAYIDANESSRFKVSTIFEQCAWAVNQNVTK